MLGGRESMRRLGPPGSFSREAGEAVQLERSALISVRRGQRPMQHVGIGRARLTTRRLVLDFRRWNYLYWLALPVLFRPLMGTFEAPLREIDEGVVARATSVRLESGGERISLDFKLGRQLFQEGLAEEWVSGIVEMREEAGGEGG